MNSSDQRRYALITSVNKRRNNPTKSHHHPKYSRLDMLPSSAIAECGRVVSTEDKAFILDPGTDSSHKIKAKAK